VRSATSEDHILCAELLGREEFEDNDLPKDSIIKSLHDSKQISTQLEADKYGESNPQEPPSTIVDPEELIGCTFLMDKQDDGQQLWARIVKLVQDHEAEIDRNPAKLKFLLSINNDKAEEIISYNQLLDYLSCDSDNENVWKFHRIVSHQGPLKQGHNEYKGSPYNVLIEWETGEITSEPLDIIAADDPVSCAINAKDHGLLDKPPGWKRFKSIAKQEKSKATFL
jgi:hypothetical protein